MEVKDETENDDSYIYNGVEYYRETVVFICKAISHYIQQLEAELDAVKTDPVLGDFVGEEYEEDSEVVLEIDHMNRCLEYFSKNIETSRHFVGLGALSHGLVRKLKAICIRYFNYLEHHRDQFSSRNGITGVSLKAVDTRLSAVKRSLSSGVFEKATPLPLLVDSFIEASKVLENHDKSEEKFSANSVTVSDSQRRPVVISTIEIKDLELRRRCLDLVIKFQHDGDSDRLDSVVREATVVLEGRLRDLLQDNEGIPVKKLIENAFGSNPKIPVTSVPAELQGVHALFRGTFGFIRNRHHHKLSTELQVIEVIQILGFIDYLLALLEGYANSNES